MTASAVVRKPRKVSVPRGNASLWRSNLNVNELARHVAYCKSSSVTTKEHGTKLEQLAAWLFPHLPGMSVMETNVFSHDRGHEVDVPMYNDHGVPGALVALGTTVFVECKNYEHKVGGQEVAWFDHKLQQGGSTGGILLAPLGVTGDPRDKSFAYGVVASALQAQAPRRILVVTLDDIAALTSSVDLRELIKMKIMNGSTATPF